MLTNEDKDFIRLTVEEGLQAYEDRQEKAFDRLTDDIEGLLDLYINQKNEATG